jgi:hypothetical protein
MPKKKYKTGRNLEELNEKKRREKEDTAALQKEELQKKELEKIELEKKELEKKEFEQKELEKKEEIRQKLLHKIENPLPKDHPDIIMVQFEAFWILLGMISCCGIILHWNVKRYGIVFQCQSSCSRCGKNFQWKNSFTHDTGRDDLVARVIISLSLCQLPLKKFQEFLKFCNIGKISNTTYSTLIDVIIKRTIFLAKKSMEIVRENALKRGSLKGIEIKLIWKLEIRN